MFESLFRGLNLEPDERRRAVTLGLVLFGLTGSYTLVKTVRDTAYLSTLPVSLLPWVYLAVGAFTLTATLVFVRLTRNLRPWKSLGLIAGLTTPLLLLSAWLLERRIGWAPIAFYLLTNAYGVLLASQFWTVANSLSHPREARRIYGLIGAGGLVGGAAAGAFARAVAGYGSLPLLLLPAAVLLAVVAWYAGQRERTIVVVPPAAESALPGEPGRVDQHPYVRWLALMTLSSVMITTLVDFQFKSELAVRLKSTAELTAFLGWFFVVLNLSALLMQLVLSRMLIERLGAVNSSMLLPAGLGAGALGMLFVPGLGMTLAARLWDQSLQLSVGRLTRELFFFPLSFDLRRRAKALIEVSVERIGDGFAGALLLVLSAWLGLGAHVLPVVLLALVATWALAWRGVGRGYREELGRNLRRLNLRAEQSLLSLREAGLLREKERLLDSRFERVVLEGMDLLQENAPELLAHHIVMLLQHDAPEVRRRALGWISSHRLVEHAARVEQLVRDRHPLVCNAAMLALASLRGVDVTRNVFDQLQSPDPRLRASAIALLVEYAEREHLGALVTGIVNGGRPEEREVVARTLARRRGPDVLPDMLERLLRDPEPAVRRAALTSAGHLGRREHVPVVLAALGDRATREAARTGLLAFGERIMGTLGDHLADPAIPLAVRAQIPGVLAEMGGQLAVDQLLRCPSCDQTPLGDAILRAANRLRGRDAALSFPDAPVTESLQRDVESYLRTLAQRRALPADSAVTTPEWLLLTALTESGERTLDRAFSRLALLYPPAEIRAALIGIRSVDIRRRGGALEFLDSALESRHGRLIGAIADARTDAEPAGHAEARVRARAPERDEMLQQLLGGQDSWLCACALFVAGTRRIDVLKSGIDACFARGETQVREMAHWARQQLDGGNGA